MPISGLPAVDHRHRILAGTRRHDVHVEVALVK